MLRKSQEGHVRLSAVLEYMGGGDKLNLLTEQDAFEGNLQGSTWLK